MDTEQLYDQAAQRWQRRAPNSLSDFTGRPAVFEMCRDVRGLTILDVGCGEGYCTRELKGRGAKDIVGLELSTEMLRIAQQQEDELQQGIRYLAGDVRALPFEAGQFDLVTAVFVFNYLDTAAMLQALTEIRRVLKPNGHFVFSIPHPSFPFMRAASPPFFFDFGQRGYFSGSDTKNEGSIHCMDGTILPVQMIHKPLEAYFSSLGQAGFSCLPEVRELRVQPHHLEAHPQFFEPIQDIPLHMAFRLTR